MEWNEGKTPCRFSNRSDTRLPSLSLRFIHFVFISFHLFLFVLLVEIHFWKCIKVFDENKIPNSCDITNSIKNKNKKTQKNTRKREPLIFMLCALVSIQGSFFLLLFSFIHRLLCLSCSLCIVQKRCFFLFWKHSFILQIFETRNNSFRHITFNRTISSYHTRIKLTLLSTIKSTLSRNVQLILVTGLWMVRSGHSAK